MILTLGLNHNTAPLPVRERVSFAADSMRDALTDLRTRLATVVPESAILSTCNRTEIYCATPAPHEAGPALAEWLSQARGVDASAIQPHLYTLPGDDGVRHAFRVASGLDSMVLGEPQILGQMKDAARVAQDARSLGTHLHQLFQRSFAVAKEVRSTTEIGAQSVSMAAASVRLAQRIFGDLRDTRVLFVGAGEMIELCATHFAAQHPRSISVANRTVERAERLAHRFGAESFRLADLPDQLERFDIVVSCTASSLPIVGLGMVERATRARRHRPVFMVDLAVPRDIEAEVARLDDVFLYTIDDLGKVVQSGVERRRAAVAQAEAIIETRVEAFMHWLATRQAVPLVRSLHERADTVRAVELDRARRLLARGESPEKALEALAHALTQKFLHGPTVLLQRPGADRHQLEGLVEQLLPLERQRGSAHNGTGEPNDASGAATPEAGGTKPGDRPQQ